MRGFAPIGCAAIVPIGTAAIGQVDDSARVQPVANAAVQPEAVAALKRMRDHLGTLKACDLTANSGLDVGP